MDMDALDNSFLSLYAENLKAAVYSCRESSVEHPWYGPYYDALRKMLLDAGDKAYAIVTPQHALVRTVRTNDGKLVRKMKITDFGGTVRKPITTDKGELDYRNETLVFVMENKALPPAYNTPVKVKEAYMAMKGQVEDQVRFASDVNGPGAHAVLAFYCIGEYWTYNIFNKATLTPPSDNEDETYRYSSDESSDSEILEARGKLNNAGGANIQPEIHFNTLLLSDDTPDDGAFAAACRELKAVNRSLF
ncbi:hypothetical protein GLOTRDRAFT_125135 [Gloeophyllum trabeum ATCC 11539]|uniref:Uncharacterized protein n=1 Tax=Gloeophyllum trabeum (strain ATCC 11539 / FP-39264 / Madison 617) TaxID=670483 RepID=S7QHU6_GLOTA|nr:uncharacterized protein GLOTRDRAFT_125135 [Gloeophyllum trabeum ATCC 11539]EPQ58808.1 hypothetical protein GLOTRDRAFT_125135 [Gloeophyllum trabeum ATCC 11539]